MSRPQRVCGVFCNLSSPRLACRIRSTLLWNLELRTFFRRIQAASSPLTSPLRASIVRDNHTASSSVRPRADEYRAVGKILSSLRSIIDRLRVRRCVCPILCSPEKHVAFLDLTKTSPYLLLYWFVLRVSRKEMVGSLVVLGSTFV